MGVADSRSARPDSHVILPRTTFRMLCVARRTGEAQMSYRIAAIDVHKKMWAVVVADVAGEGEYQFERHKFAATPDQLRRLAEWLVQQEVEQIVQLTRHRVRL